MPAKNIIIPQETNMKPSNFLKGQIYEMMAGYHTEHPYYVFIEKVNDKFIQTSIPNKHSLKIEYPSDGWNYHIQRMKYIGRMDNPEFKKLLHQPNLLTHNK